MLPPERGNRTGSATGLPSTSTSRSDALSAAAYLNVFTVEEYESNGKTAKKWTKIGAAFMHEEGPGFTIQLRALPLDGHLVALPPDSEGEQD